MNTSLEELYLDAENDIKANNYLEAFRKYEGILLEEPGHAATHNSMGWIYKTQLEDYKKAESHYKAAMKYEPLYPHAYLNYAVLLTDMERFEELDALLQQALEVPTIEKSWLYQRRGIMQELQLQLDAAMECYEKAALLTLNDDKMKNYRDDVERCKEKAVLAKKYGNWLQ